MALLVVLVPGAGCTGSHPAPAPPATATAARELAVEGTVVLLDHMSAPLTPGEPYPAGSLLILRVTLPAATTVHLLRDGVELWSGHLPAGESEIPSSFLLPPNEGSTAFSVTTDAGARTSLSIGKVS